MWSESRRFNQAIQYGTYPTIFGISENQIYNLGRFDKINLLVRIFVST